MPAANPVVEEVATPVVEEVPTLANEATEIWDTFRSNSDTVERLQAKPQVNQLKRAKTAADKAKKQIVAMMDGATQVQLADGRTILDDQDIRIRQPSKGGEFTVHKLIEVK